jgi:hypothetical protein
MLTLSTIASVDLRSTPFQIQLRAASSRVVAVAVVVVVLEAVQDFRMKPTKIRATLLGDHATLTLLRQTTDDRRR